MIKKFRKRPVEIEAIQFTSFSSIVEILDFCPVFQQINDSDSSIPKFGIKTLEGVMEASMGDWIIKGIKGEFYPCKPDIFKMTYDELI